MAPLVAASPPPPPIDCSRMPWEFTPLVLMKPVLASVPPTLPPSLPLPPEPPKVSAREAVPCAALALVNVMPPPPPMDWASTPMALRP
ncbi:MAG: hypothetical protein ABII76_07885, partial [Pseudomonadota bacterium]